MEYKELKAPEEILTRLTEMQNEEGRSEPATLGEAGFFDWVNKLSQDEGWSIVWQAFNFPYLVLEREVSVAVPEEVQN
jgi:hypothetical protein